MSFIDATALICGSSLARFSVMPCSPFTMSLRLVCSCRLFSMPMCRHCLRVSVSCALRGIRTQAMANVNNNLFISFFSFIRCKDRKLELYSRYDIFVPYVHIFRFYIRSSKTSWETAIVMADSSLPYLIYYSTPVAYHYGPFILNNASSQESGMVKRELVG